MTTRTMRLLVTILGGFALLLSFTLGAAGAVPGSSGLGDPYFPFAGNGGYDALSYRVKLAYDPSTGFLEGRGKMKAIATEDLASFDLDLRDFVVSSVKVNDAPATYAHEGQELIVTPAANIAMGTQFQVVVKYSGTPGPVVDPDGSWEGWVPTSDGAFVVGEPQGSPAWFPVNDYPTDKATYRFRVTVPVGITAVANGRLVSRTTKSGHTTFVWRHDYPMASYLATVTTGVFNVERYTTASGIPVYNAVDPSQVGKSRPVLRKLPKIIDFYSSVFGPYPFEAAGAIVDYAPDVGYSLETQTRPVFWRAPSEATFAHEIAHQWLGDSVTLSTWPDIWLNEGFATWSEWYWKEYVGGRDVAQTFNALYAKPASDTSFWNPPPGDPGGAENLFDGTIYNRGGMTLEALRQKLGDATFFDIMRTWVDENSYGNVTTADFIALAEAKSSMNLDAFFDVWLYQPGKPMEW
jgi:aminopeptidase N